MAKQGKVEIAYQVFNRRGEESWKRTVVRADKVEAAIAKLQDKPNYGGEFRTRPLDEVA